MKKQKKPIILVLILAALFFGVALMNKPEDSGKAQNPASAPADAAKPEDKSETSKLVASQVKGAGKDKKEAPAPKKGPMMKGNMHNTGPLLLKIKTAPQKPKPNDSATSNQWYTPESARNNPK